jgi:hypothetical protein
LVKGRKEKGGIINENKKRRKTRKTYRKWERQ